MRSRRDILARAVGGACLVGTIGRPGALQAADPLARLAEGGRALIMRHALAPGTGDPGGFRLGECATQRNLNDAGRTQARALGARLRAAGVVRARVLSSRWCRCLETAELLGVGPVEPFDPLNSFFGEASERGPRTEALGRFLASIEPGAAPLVMVTHQVNITALTAVVPASGEGLVLRLDRTARPPVEARVPVDT